MRCMTCLTEIEIKPKKLKTPWFSKRLKKSSKTKQRLYIKFLKNKSAESEEKYKNYKNLFEKLKIKSKKNYYASLLNKYKYDTKQTWQVMKEITGKQKTKSSSLPTTIKTKQGITEKESEISKEFNKYFTSAGTALASKIPIVFKDVSECLPQCNVSMEHKELSFSEFEKAFKALKILISLEEAVFSEKLKIEKVIPIFKKKQFLFFQFIPKCLKVLCIIVCMNISGKSIWF